MRRGVESMWNEKPADMRTAREIKFVARRVLGLETVTCAGSFRGIMGLRYIGMCIIFVRGGRALRSRGWLAL